MDEHQELQEDLGEPHFHDHPKKSNSWIPFAFALAFLGAIGIAYSFINTAPTPEKIALQQLQAIQDNHLLVAYREYTSNQFRERTSFETFAAIVGNTPVLAENRSAHFYNESINDDHGTLTAVLTAQDLSIAPVLFVFVKEEGTWKVDDLKLLESGALRNPTILPEIALEESPALPLSQDLRLAMIAQIESYLNALKNNDVDRAYAQYTTQDFTNATPPAALKDLIQEYPALKTFQSVSFGEGSFDGTHAKITATLHTQRSSLPIRYTLAKENNKWKIFRSQMLAESGGNQKVSPREHQALVHMIQNHLNTLKQEDIYNAYHRFTSKQFKATTSLPEFEQFVENYPELKLHQTSKFGKSSIKDGLRTIPLTLFSENGESSLDLWLIKEGTEWKLWGMDVTKSASFPPLDASEKEKLAELISEHLGAIQSRDFSKAYYAFASKEFEETTSLDKFKAFLENYPIFFSFNKMEVKDGIREGDLSVLRITLMGENEKESTIDYRLVQEGPKWKLWGLQVLTSSTASSTPNFHREKLIQVVQNQINAIREQDLSKAYYAFSSPQFQITTTRDSFGSFISGYPELKENSKLEVDDIQLKKGIATVLAKLSSKDGGRKTFEWRLVQEKDRWKILSVKRIPKEDDLTVPKIMQFAKASLGTDVDLQGMVINPQTSFDENKKQITLNLFIENGKPGAVIEVTLEHLESSSMISPVNTTLTDEGDAVVTFIFTPPTQGWPLGKYRLHTTSTSPNLDEVYSFEIED